MKILYDFRAFQIFYQRGVSRYIYNMFESAIRQNPETAYILLCRDMVSPEFAKGIEKKIRFVYEDELLSHMWDGITFDCFIQGSACWLNLPPEKAISRMYPEEIMSHAKVTGCIVYDFIPVFFQQYIAGESARNSFALQQEMLKNLDHLFTDSMFTLGSGVRYLKRPASDFTCLYGGADVEKFKTSNSSRPYDEKERGNHLVYVSGAALQKNTEGFTQAFCKAYKRGKIPKDAKLYIICHAPQSFIDEIARITVANGCKYKKQVEATGFISDEKMISLLANARSSIFPSFYEGLGLPILESYAAGTPCWASGCSATKEVTLPECTFDPFSEISMINAVETIYRSPDLCSKSLAYGREVLKEMNWDIGARKMLDKLEELLEEKNEGTDGSVES